MKDKFEIFLTMLTEKTREGKAKWEELSQGQYKLQFKNHYVILTFHITLLKKPEYPIQFDVFTNEGKIILQLIQKAPAPYQTELPDRYYNRLHALARAVRGEYHTIEDTVDLLMKDIPF